MGLTHAPAVENHRLTGREARVAAVLNDARKVDPGNERKFANDRFTRQREGILVVDGRPFHTDVDGVIVCLAQEALVHRFHGCDL